jgi:hypothetical protein
MAKRGRKTAAIQEVLAAKPGASVKEIQSALAAKRVKASVALISKLKSGKPGNGMANGVTFDQLLAAKTFVAKMGSVQAAKSALDSFAKLTQ